MLYIVATPIGNIRDITLRALDALKESDYIVAEDTRSTGILFKAHEIEKRPFISYNDYNSLKKIPKIIQLLKEGYTISLVSENGTPAISDPGYKLIRECIKNDIKVVPIPGATAFVNALVASGLPTDRFAFYGFLPKSKKKKKELFFKVKEDEMTGIFYESPHRIIKTVEALDEDFPDDIICIAREISKKFEEFIRGKPKDILEKFSYKKPKGEFVLVLGK